MAKIVDLELNAYLKITLPIYFLSDLVSLAYVIIKNHFFSKESLCFCDVYITNILE